MLFTVMVVVVLLLLLATMARHGVGRRRRMLNHRERAGNRLGRVTINLPQALLMLPLLLVHAWRRGAIHHSDLWHGRRRNFMVYLGWFLEILAQLLFDMVFLRYIVLFVFPYELFLVQLQGLLLLVV
jgi:hypothetical protein